MSNCKEYDPLAKENELPKFFSACIYGKRRSGKGVFSHWLVNKIHKKHKFSKAVLFSRSSKLQEDDWQFIPENDKYDTFSDSKLEDIVAEHKKEVMKWKETKEGDQPNMLVIIDDLIAPSGGKGETIFYSKALTDLYVLGRHIFVSVISLLQSIKSSLPPMSRKNCDLIVYFRSPSKTDIETLVNDYLLLSDKTSKEAKALLNKVTEEKYTALGIDNNLAQYAQQYEDFVFCVRCKPVKTNFMIGDDSEKPFYKIDKEYNIRSKTVASGVKL